jgi:hypothetical protein
MLINAGNFKHYSSQMLSELRRKHGWIVDIVIAGAEIAFRESALPGKWQQPADETAGFRAAPYWPTPPPSRSLLTMSSLRCRDHVRAEVERVRWQP